MSDLPAEDWRPLADQVAANARDFLDGLEGAVERREVAFGFGEEKFTHPALSAFLNNSRKTG